MAEMYIVITACLPERLRQYRVLRGAASLNDVVHPPPSDGGRGELPINQLAAYSGIIAALALVGGRLPGNIADHEG